ncbi:MAG TPA: ATP-binding protein, partial [Verrucomicrobiae bacterium]|nr:ATP-binding protein [Verrucomicrobiae bacterium]
MPLLRLIAENIGPFEKLDIDFSDGNGKPHLGPHILAGVNGSGKSTVLRAIAWALDKGKHGFPMEEWRHSLRPVGSKTLVQVSSGGR